MLKNKTSLFKSVISLIVFLLAFAYIGFNFSGKTSGKTFSPLFAFDWFQKKSKLEKLEMTNKVLYYIKERYVDPTKVNLEKMFLSALEKLQEEIPEVLLKDKDPSTSILFVDNKRIEIGKKVRDVNDLKNKLSTVLVFINKNMTSKLTEIQLETAAISGVLNTLDPHSILLSPDFYQETKVNTSGKFGGLGIQITLKKDGSLVVIAPIVDTPAYRAGIKAGDVITKIEDESTINMPLNDAVDRMRGDRGTACNITISREGFSEPKTFKIVRDIIIVKSVEAYKLNDSVAYIRLKNFQEDTTTDLFKNLSNLKSSMKSLKGLVLDLRSNPGGLLDQAINVSDVFLKSGTILTTVGNSKDLTDVQTAQNQHVEPDFPIAVLVDGGSASASEIVAGALKNNNRAVIIGRQTFGKGSVQKIYPDLPESWALKLTIAEYLTPGDRSIQSYGIMPDIQLSPVLVDKDDMNLLRSDRRIREEDLEQHIEQKEKHNEKPLFQVKYLLPNQPKTQTDDIVIPKQETPEEKLANIKKDFEVSIAAEIVSQAKFTDRELLLKSINPIIKGNTDSEQEKIREALSKTGVDWSEPRLASAADLKCTPPKATVAVSSPQGKATAGEEVTIKVRVDNEGDCTLYKLWGISESDTPLFSEREFIFGKIAPHQSKESTLKIKIPKGVQEKLVRISVKFDEKSGNLPTTINEAFTMAEDKKPAFALNYQIIDDGTHKSVGNGNGLIEKGETITMLLAVKNIGTGKSFENIASLKNIAGKGIFLIKGRDKIGDLESGKTRHVEFLFSVREYFEKSDFELEIAAIDTVFREFLDDKIKFKIWNNPGSPTPVKKSVLAKGREVQIYGSPDTDAPIIASLPAQASLSANKEFGKFYGIVLPDDRSGWILKESVTALTKMLQTDQSRLVAYKMVKIPPKISFAQDRAVPLETAGNSIIVRGNIYDEISLKDMYVLVNSKKVFYESFKPAAAKLSKKNFELSVPLEDGTNNISVIARDEENLTMRNFMSTYKTVPGKFLSDSKQKRLKEEFFLDN